MGHSEHEGRGLCMNFLKNLKPSNVTEEPQSMSNDVQFQGNGFTTGIDNNMVDKLHLYKNVNASANAVNLFLSSRGPYNRNMQRRATHAQKYFTYT